VFKTAKIEHGVSGASSVSVCLKNVGRQLFFLIRWSEIVCVTDPVTESGGADTSNLHPAGHGLRHSCVKPFISIISIYKLVLIANLIHNFFIL
jgi:hypothetical protein